MPIMLETWNLGKYAYHLAIETVMHNLDDLIYVANVIICIQTFFSKSLTLLIRALHREVYISLQTKHANILRIYMLVSSRYIILHDLLFAFQT